MLFRVRHRFHRHYGVGSVLRVVGPYYIVEWEGVKASSMEPVGNVLRITE